jgi:hypothetical protein
MQAPPYPLLPRLRNILPLLLALLLLPLFTLTNYAQTHNILTGPDSASTTPQKACQNLKEIHGLELRNLNPKEWEILPTKEVKNVKGKPYRKTLFRHLPSNSLYLLWEDHLSDTHVGTLYTTNETLSKNKKIGTIQDGVLLLNRRKAPTPAPILQITNPTAIKGKIGIPMQIQITTNPTADKYRITPSKYIGNNTAEVSPGITLNETTGTLTGTPKESLAKTLTLQAFLLSPQKNILTETTQGIELSIEPN